MQIKHGSTYTDDIVRILYGIQAHFEDSQDPNELDLAADVGRAAQEIERLREEVKKLREALDKGTDG